jgi:hypothetical protein
MASWSSLLHGGRLRYLRRPALTPSRDVISAGESLQILAMDQHSATDTAHWQLLCGDQILDFSQAYVQAISAFT